jgi:uncharacterized protein YndB with AHSA1/START domain
MPYAFTLTAVIPASPQEVYDAWLDSLGHSEMTGGKANMSDQIDAEVSAWDGYINGRNLELIPGERIVQSWRTAQFGDEHEDSIVTVVLTQTGDGTLLTLEHSNVPDEQRSYEEGGWHSNYFEPMAAYFTARKQEATGAAVPRAARKRPSKPPAKRAPKARPPAKSKSKRASSPTHAAPRKTKTKTKTKARRSTAASARGRTRPAGRKSGRGKRK